MTGLHRRTDEDGRPTDLEPLDRGGARGPVVVSVLVAVILVIALVKPWNAGGLVGSTPGAEATAGSGVPAASGPSDAVRPTSAPLATPGLTSDVLTPFVTPAPSGEGLIECLRFDAWRLLSISSSQGRLIRTWTAMTPMAGAGPDAVLDYPRVSDGVVLDVGYCGPTALLPGDAASAAVIAWWRPDRSTPAEQLGVLRPAFTSGSASRALYLPPVVGGLRNAPAPDRWYPGFYAFHLVAGMPNSLDVWFGAEVVATGP